MPGNRLKKHRREQIRASILIVLDVARPVTTGERTLHSALGEADDYIGQGELRRALKYLEDKGLVEIDEDNPHQWKVLLTSKGVDVVQKARDLPPGIGPIDLDAMK
jgi:predicted transcriptional regulator